MSANMFCFRIREISGLEKLSKLEELYIADNGLTHLKGLETNNLQTIEIANNKIEDLSGELPVKLVIRLLNF